MRAHTLGDLEPHRPALDVDLLDDATPLDVARGQPAGDDQRGPDGRPPADRGLGEGRTWRHVMATVRAQLADDVAALEGGRPIDDADATRAPRRVSRGAAG